MGASFLQCFFKNSWNIKGTAVNLLVYAVFEKITELNYENL